MMKGLAILVCAFTLTACSVLMPLTPEERVRLESRAYPQPLTTIQEAAAQTVRNQMGMVETVQEGPSVVLNGVTSAGGGTVGYRVRVELLQEGQQIRVRPHFSMNVSSDPGRPLVVPTSADEKPRLYEDFFEDLEGRLSRNPR